MTDWTEERQQLTAKLAEAYRRLDEMRERYALVTSAARVGIWDWNLETGDFYLDPNIKAYLGYEDNETLNDLRHWENYIHPGDKEAILDAAQATIEGRSTEYAFEHRVRHKDGSLRWFMVRGKVTRDHLGKAVRFLGTGTDVTDRRELEQHVRDLSNDLQSRIGNDLHDSLGQELTGLMLKLSVLESKLGPELADLAQEASEARALVQRTIETTAALARGLSPDVSSAGLVPSLMQLAEDARRIFGIECDVKLAEDLPWHSSAAHCNELYRIVQESITNAVRHGEATRIAVEGRVVGGRFLLSIVDNGVGKGMCVRGTASMGLRIMQCRARSIGGSLTISRRRDGSTLVVCSFAVPA